MDGDEGSVEITMGTQTSRQVAGTRAEVSSRIVQSVIEELIRGVGYGALRLVTFGRYRGGEDSRLAEGAIGFGLVVAVAYVFYAVGSR